MIAAGSTRPPSRASSVGRAPRATAPDGSMPPLPAMPRQERGCARRRSGRRPPARARRRRGRRRSRPGSGRPPRPARRRRSARARQARPSRRTGRAGRHPRLERGGSLGRRAAPSLEIPVDVRGENGSSQARDFVREERRVIEQADRHAGHWPALAGEDEHRRPSTGLPTTPSTSRARPALGQAGESLKPFASLPPITTARCSRAGARGAPVSSRHPRRGARRLLEQGHQPSGAVAERRASLGREDERQGGANPGSAVGRRPAAPRRPSAAVPRHTTWQLVPPMPNELTPATSGRSRAGQASASVCDPQAQLVQRDRPGWAARS